MSHCVETATKQLECFQCGRTICKGADYVWLDEWNTADRKHGKDICGKCAELEEDA